MIRFLLILALVFSFVSQKGFANREKPYLAVYAQKDFAQEWSKYHPDTLYLVKDWSKFDAFLTKVAARSGTKPIELDIDCHGIDDGLYIDDEKRHISHRASMGYIISHIEEKLHGRNLTVFTEACYSGRAYQNTIRGSLYQYAKDDKMGDFQTIPSFPIYGIGDKYFNYGNLIWLQHHTGNKDSRFFYDLRDFELMALREKDENVNSQAHLYIFNFWQKLMLLP